MALNPGIFDTDVAGDLVDLSIQDKWLKTPGSEHMQNFRKFCNVRTGNPDETVKDTALSGAGSFQRKAEGAVRPKDRPIQGFDKSATMVEYAVQFEVTKRMWIFGIKKNDMESVVTSYKTMAMERRERDAELRLDNSFATSYTSEEGVTITTTGGNTDALISDAQEREDSGTDNNNEVGDGTTEMMDFEYDALKALFLRAAAIKSLRGEQMSVEPDTLVFKRGSAISFRAKEINGATKIPGSNENDAKGTPAMKILELAYLSNAAYWWAFDSSMVNSMFGIQYVETQDITLGDQIVNEDTGNFKYNVDAIYEYYHNDFRGWFGSDGTNSS